MARLFIFWTCLSTSSARAVVGDASTQAAITNAAMTDGRSMSPLLLRRDDELGAPIGFASPGGAVVVDRLRRPEAACLHALGVDAVLDEELLDRVGAIVRQLHVVLERAA